MVELASQKISVDKLLTELEDHAAGGVAIFLGRVRNHAEGRAVTKMDYEAHPSMALKKMREIEDQAKQRWPIKKMIIVHRVGRLQLGEVSVAIAIACPHRKEAFAACQFAIDTLKETVPIWKKEHYVDGEAWVEGVVPNPLD